jgi:esterase
MPSIIRDQVQISYEISRCANSGRPPVVFIHGLASNRSRWNEFIANTSLNLSHDLISLDLRGHGESMTRQAFSLEIWAQDIRALLLEHNAHKAILVGHSLGAQTALFFGTQCPQMLAGLILIDPVFREAVVPAKRSYSRNAPFYQTAANCIRLLNRIGIHRSHLPHLDLQAMDLKAREALASNNPQALKAFVKEYSSTRIDLKHIPHANYLQDLVEMFRLLPDLSVIQCPVLALRSTVAGYQDDLMVKQRLNQMSNLEVQAIACHHWPITERPLEVRQAIEAWVAHSICSTA